MLWLLLWAAIGVIDGLRDLLVPGSWARVRKALRRGEFKRLLAFIFGCVIAGPLRLLARYLRHKDAAAGNPWAMDSDDIRAVERGEATYAEIDAERRAKRERREAFQREADYQDAL